MPTDVIMPPLSQTMDVVVLLQWLKRAGEPVVKGEALFRIETDKATLEIEAPASGILQQILVPEKSEVKVRSRVAVIASPDEAAPARLAEGAAPTAAPPNLPATPTTRATEAPTLPPKRRQRIFASPRARGLAEREGVALVGLTPTGSQGMIVERDVQAYLATRRSAPAAPAVWRQPAGVAAFVREVDLTELLAWQARMRSAAPAEPLTHTDLLVSIVARVLALHPRLNAVVEGDSLTLCQDVHIALGSASAGNPSRLALRHAERKRPLDLARERAAWATQPAAVGLDAGAFALTDMGPAGVDLYMPGITPPQIAALGLGRIRPMPALRGGVLCTRQVMSLALTVDSRWVDDAPAALFLADVVQWIEEPYRML